jgi:regulator of protease activity HflC (stomatin/prohibitin superfamily)
MQDPMMELNRDHLTRQIDRVKTRTPVLIVAALILLATIPAGIVLVEKDRTVTGAAVIVVGVLLAVLWNLSAQLLAEWDRAVVLRVGHFQQVRGPGFFLIVPILDRVSRIIDMRVRTTTFYGESMLTRDTVPVDIDAIAFWHVWDARKSILEVESYYRAIVLAVQTALRDIVGLHTLAEVLSERDKIGETLQRVLQQKMEAWGMSVASIEIRDILIPETLKDALSKQAQAERERQSRTILGEAEMEIAQKFAEASKAYQGNPVALQLRAMNILYEGLRAGGSMMLVPSSVLDTMNLGGMAALGMARRAEGEAPLGKPGV